MLKTPSDAIRTTMSPALLRNVRQPTTNQAAPKPVGLRFPVSSADVPYPHWYTTFSGDGASPNLANS